MAGFCQRCGARFSEKGPLCPRCLPDGCDVAGFRGLAEALGLSKTYVDELGVSSVFNMPTVDVGGQKIYCTNVSTARWEHDEWRWRDEGLPKRIRNLSQFRTDPSSNR